ncbi:hypothetical protein DVH24_026629 [Malus domestica]|uniref:Yos1-like protein n=2 Tax=Malus domestica TaxID=3750 RepID=A0A498K1Q3_MALDO|nr:hypothetical protein DVH24_026629 [Malus domestica]
MTFGLSCCFVSVLLKSRRTLSTEKRLAKMGLWTVFQGFLLLANAFAILNEDRFLGPRGWTLLQLQGGRRTTLKGQIIGFIHACQFFRFPLILLNLVTIVVKLISG